MPLLSALQLFLEQPETLLAILPLDLCIVGVEIDVLRRQMHTLGSENNQFSKYHGDIQMALSDR